MSFSLDPGVIALLAGACLLYARAIRVLARRGQVVRRRQQALWYVGIGLTAIGLMSPIDTLGEDLLMAHMAQHLLIADLAAPLLLAGLRFPVLVFFLPRPVLVPLARQKRVRSIFAQARRPLTAVLIYVFVLYGWHFKASFEAAMASPALHAVQHESWVVASLLVWWSVIEPGRRRPRGELWKAGHIVGARLAGMFLGIAFLAMQSPAYEPYATAPRKWGIDPVTDQQLAGGMMMGVDFAVMSFALTWFFWAAARAHDRSDEAAVATDAGPIGA